MSHHNAFRDGKVYVCAHLCKTCVFRPGNLMHLEPGRVEAMSVDAIRNDSAIICHSTLDGEAQAVCRGFFDKHSNSTIPLRLARVMGNIKEV